MDDVLFFVNLMDPFSVSLGEEHSKDCRDLLFHLMVQFRILVVVWHFGELLLKTLL